MASISSNSGFSQASPKPSLSSPTTQLPTTLPLYARQLDPPRSTATFLLHLFQAFVAFIVTIVVMVISVFTIFLFDSPFMKWYEYLIAYSIVAIFFLLDLGMIWITGWAIWRAVGVPGLGITIVCVVFYVTLVGF